MDLRRQFATLFGEHGPAAGAVLVLIAASVIFASFAHLANRLPGLADTDTLLQSTSSASEAARNVRWATGAGLRPIIDQERGVKPPLYPATLYGAHQLGLGQFYWLNAFCYLVIALAMIWLARDCLAPHWVPALAAFALLFKPFHEQFLSIKSEPLFTAWAILMLVALRRYWEGPTWGQLSLVAAALGAACLTRYMGLFWLVPVAALAVGFIHRRALATALTRVTTLVALAVAPTLAYMLNNYSKTGFLTGMDRVETRFPIQDTVLSRFILTMVDTPLVVLADFTTLRYQRYVAASNSLLEKVAAVPVAVWLSLALIAVIVSELRRPVRAAMDEKTSRADKTLLLTALFFFSYVAVFLAIWTFGNNDFVWTRFVIPMYPFMLLLLIAGSAALTPDHGRFGWLPGAAVGFALLLQVVALGALWFA